MGPRAAASAVALSIAALALAACGGAVATDLFSGPGVDPSATPTPTGTTTGATDGSVPPGPTSTVPPTPTTPPTDPPPPPPPPPVDAGRPDARVDSGTVDAGTDASTGMDGGGGPGITCGPGLSCGLTQTCCAVYVVPNYRFECRAGTAATCPNPSTDIHCDSSEDCPTSARLCCGDKALSGTYYNALTCRSSCTGNDVVFCDPASPATSCRPGQKCEASTILKGFHYCD